jgi:D-amino peptidase
VPALQRMKNHTPSPRKTRLAISLLRRVCSTVPLALLAGAMATAPAQTQRAPKIFISVDLEGIGGIGTPQMSGVNGKDYGLGRELATEEVNAVVAAILERGPAEILVNDAHGDMQNLLHTRLDPRVSYIQGAVKPLGMVEGLDSTFDAVIFLGYHARAGTANAFLAHTGTMGIQEMWIDGEPAGEGEMNAAFARAMGVPVVLASGDSAFVEQIARTVPGAERVPTKAAVSQLSARLVHPQLVRDSLAAATRRALDRMQPARPAARRGPVRVRIRFSDPGLPHILEAIPGVRRDDGYTVAFTSPCMPDAYRLIRLMYRFVTVTP